MRRRRRGKERKRERDTEGGIEIERKEWGRESRKRMSELGTNREGANGERGGRNTELENIPVFPREGKERGKKEKRGRSKKHRRN